MTADTHARLHCVCMALHRASEAIAEEMQRTAEIQRGGPEVEAEAWAWVTRNAQAFVDLAGVKRRMLRVEPMDRRTAARTKP